MLVAHDSKELSNIVEAIKKEAVWKRLSTGDKAKILGMNIDFGSKNSTDTKYAWMNYHGTVRHNDEVLDIKVPTTIGKILTAIRYWGEEKFNQKYLIKESPDESIEREIKTYEYLNEHNFPTLSSMNKYFPEIEGAVITRKVLGAKPFIDVITASDSYTQRKLVGDIAELMRKMHDTGVIWGDAWLGNAIYDNDRLLLYDFGLRPNPSKKQEFLIGKEIIALCTSATFKTGQAAKMIIPAVIEAYNPPSNVSENIRQILYENAKQDHGHVFRFLEEQMYFNPVYGMNRKDVETIREEIRKNINKKFR